MEIIKEIKNSPFKPPIRKYYLGKIKHHTPYFLPRGFNKNIFSIRKLIRKTPKELEEEDIKYPLRSKYNRQIYKNLPMVRRSKDWIFPFFGIAAK